ncbi:MAG: hypothetical protein HRF42_07000 [Candidatus Brocadia sp.]
MKRKNQLGETLRLRLRVTFSSIRRETEVDGCFILSKRFQGGTDKQSLPVPSKAV